MKKFLLLCSTVLMLTVCFCVPALAVDGECSAHIWADGVCSDCGAECPHSFSSGVCYDCGMTCGHSFVSGYCSTCGETCQHSWVDGVCSICKVYCSHYFGSDHVCYDCGWACDHGGYPTHSCPICNYSSDHEWVSGVCVICNITCSHPSWSNGACFDCGYPCDHGGQPTHYCPTCNYSSDHEWVSGVCVICDIACSHSAWNNGICVDCGIECNHDFNLEICIVCGFVCPHSEYSDGYCVLCGVPDLTGFVCPHFNDLSSVFIYVDSDRMHKFGCAFCSWSMPVGQAYSLFYRVPLDELPSEYLQPHPPEGCVFCGEDGLDMQTQFLGLYCSHVMESLTVYACTDAHYLSCDLCGYHRPFVDFLLSIGYTETFYDPGHMEGSQDDLCAVIQTLADSEGLSVSIVPVDEPGSSYFDFSILSSTTNFVDAAASWVSTFATTIVNTPILLVSAILAFIGFGIGIFKRLRT